MIGQVVSPPEESHDPLQSSDQSNCCRPLKNSQFYIQNKIDIEKIYIFQRHRAREVVEYLRLLSSVSLEEKIFPLDDVFVFFHTFRIPKRCVPHLVENVISILKVNGFLIQISFLPSSFLSTIWQPPKA